VIPDTRIEENSLANEKQREAAQAVEVAQALALHEAMVKVCSAARGGFSGVLDWGSFAPLLKEQFVPWPQIGELEELAQSVEDGGCFDASDFHAELLALIDDLAIWMVERYFRPASPVEVSQLNLDLQKAGLGFLLYQCFVKERQWLDQDEQACFQRLFEHWINSVWDGKIELPLPADIQTVGQLIAWLGRKGETHIPYLIRQTMRELAEQP